MEFKKNAMLGKNYAPSHEINRVEDKLASFFSDSHLQTMATSTSSLHMQWSQQP